MKNSTKFYESTAIKNLGKGKTSIYIIVVLFFMLFSAVVSAQLVTYDYPGTRTNDTRNMLSDQYRVWVKIGSNTEKELDVVWSEGSERSCTGGMPADLEADIKSKTFSYAHVSYNNNGQKLTFRVQRLYSGTINSVKLQPKNYGISPTVNSTKDEITFQVSQNKKFISVLFDGPGNKTSNKSWVKHMLVIAVDPLESNAHSKTGSGVVVYSNSASA